MLRGGDETQRTMQNGGVTMRLASIMSTVVIAMATMPYILNHGIRAAVPLLVSLVCGIIWSVTA